MQASDQTLDPTRWRLVDPLGYFEFLKLMSAARVVLTDEDVQEETTVLGVPCVTLRENTERPVDRGNEPVAGTSREAAFEDAVGHDQSRRAPQLWDGHAAERIAASPSSAPVSPRSVAAPRTLCYGSRLPRP